MENMENLEALIGLGVAVGTILVGFLLGWIISGLHNIYYNYHAKKNHANHPKLFELINERDKILAKRSCWWHQKYKAEKEMQDYEEKIRYGGSTPELCKKLTKSHADWREAFENLERSEPVLIDAREAVDSYREEHNIRHW